MVEQAETKQPPKALLEDVLKVEGEDGRAHLVISRCDDCGAKAFPPRERCARCSGRNLRSVEAPGDGTLYTYTIVRELGKRREGFVPFALGQVDLDDDLRVIGVVAAAPDALSIGMRLHTILLPQGKDEEGNKLVGYGFAPVAD